MAKLDIGVGEPFPLDEKSSGGDCRHDRHGHGHSHHHHPDDHHRHHDVHHHHSFWHDYLRARFSRGRGRSRSDDKQGKE